MLSLLRARGRLAAANLEAAGVGKRGEIVVAAVNDQRDILCELFLRALRAMDAAMDKDWHEQGQTWCRSTLGPDHYARVAAVGILTLPGRASRGNVDRHRHAGRIQNRQIPFFQQIGNPGSKISDRKSWINGPKWAGCILGCREGDLTARRTAL